MAQPQFASGVFQPRPDDDDDVRWNLSTALARWTSGGRADAIVWVRRAAEAAQASGSQTRANELRASAAQLAEHLWNDPPESELPSDIEVDVDLETEDRPAPLPPPPPPGAALRPPPPPPVATPPERYSFQNHGANRQSLTELEPPRGHFASAPEIELDEQPLDASELEEIFEYVGEDDLEYVSSERPSRGGERRAPRPSAVLPHPMETADDFNDRLSSAGVEPVNAESAIAELREQEAIGEERYSDAGAFELRSPVNDTPSSHYDEEDDDFDERETLAPAPSSFARAPQMGESSRGTSFDEQFEEERYSDELGPTELLEDESALAIDADLGLPGQGDVDLGADWAPVQSAPPPSARTEPPEIERVTHPASVEMLDSDELEPVSLQSSSAPESLPPLEFPSEPPPYEAIDEGPSLGDEVGEPEREAISESAPPSEMLAATSKPSPASPPEMAASDDAAASDPEPVSLELSPLSLEADSRDQPISEEDTVPRDETAIHLAEALAGKQDVPAQEEPEFAELEEPALDQPEPEAPEPERFEPDLDFDDSEPIESQAAEAPEPSEEPQLSEETQPAGEAFVEPQFELDQLASELESDFPLLDADSVPAPEAASKAATGTQVAEQPALDSSEGETPPRVRAAWSAEGTAIDGIDLMVTRGFEDLPEEAQERLVQVGRVEHLAEGEAVGRFGAAIVTKGLVSVLAQDAHEVGAFAEESDVVFTQGTLDESIALRVVAKADDTRVAVWEPSQLEEALAECPWVQDELRFIADRFLALCGATLGPLGQRLDESLRSTVFQRLEVKVLGAFESLTQKGEPLPGLFVVSGGLVEVWDGEEKIGEKRAGDFLFPDAMMSGQPSPATARAGEGGALTLFATRSVAHELMISVPPLLEVLAG